MAFCLIYVNNTYLYFLVYIINTLYVYIVCIIRGFSGGSDSKESTCNTRDFWSLVRKDTLEEEMATHSSILAWEIPWTEEPSRLQSIGLESQTRLSNWARAHTHTHTHKHTRIVYIVIQKCHIWKIVVVIMMMSLYFITFVELGISQKCFL